MERMRICRVVACAAVAALVAPAVASAHANLVRLRPANGVVLATPPAAVRVLFDDAIRPGPGVEAIRNGGGSVLAGRAYVPRGNRRELVIPLRHRLAAGNYSVRWSVVSDDGHNERGVTAFAVGAGSAPPTRGAFALSNFRSSKTAISSTSVAAPCARWRAGTTPATATTTGPSITATTTSPDERRVPSSSQSSRASSTQRPATLRLPISWRRACGRDCCRSHRSPR